MSTNTKSENLSQDRLVGIITELLKANPPSVEVMGSSRGIVTLDINGDRHITGALPSIATPPGELDLSGVHAPPNYKVDRRTESYRGLTFTYVTFQRISELAVPPETSLEESHI